MNLYSWPFAAPGLSDDVGLYWSPSLSAAESIKHYAAFYAATSLVHDATRAMATALLVIAGEPVLRPAAVPCACGLGDITARVARALTAAALCFALATRKPPPCDKAVTAHVCCVRTLQALCRAQRGLADILAHIVFNLPP